MSSNEIAVSVRNVSKSYRIVHAERATTLGETIASRIRKPFHRVQKETFWALKDISIDIPKGDVVGIVGRNGAGKSTFLKVLSRITAPTTGEIVIHGRVGSLLEVGTGFHPELTGRENIYLNGAILGMKSKEIDAQFDAIVDFSGVEQFLDTPVKRYSSGMYVRLAFSVAAHLNPEVMIVDEVLAVGDAEFQEKCMGKMQDVARGGKTVLFVSHNMHSVTTLCKSAILLQKGELLDFGPVEPIVERYIDMRENEEIDLTTNHERRLGSGSLRVTSAKPLTPVFGVNDDKVFDLRIEKFSDRATEFNLMFLIITDRTGPIVYIESEFINKIFEPLDSQDVRITIPNLPLRPGKYKVCTYIKRGDDLMDIADPALYFEVSPVLPYAGASIAPESLHAPFLVDFTMTPLPIPPK